MSKSKRCAICSNVSVVRDVLEFNWCEAHRFRADISAWGQQHDYPELPCWPYAIGPDRECWQMALAAGNDDFLQMALAAIEDLRDGAA